MPGVTVIGEAENGLVGLALIRGLKPDVVVLDLQMPVLNGVAVLRAIREQRLQTKVVVMTSDPYMETELRGLGADAVVLKIESADKLLPVLKRVATAPTNVPCIFCGEPQTQEIAAANGTDLERWYECPHCSRRFAVK